MDYIAGKMTRICVKSVLFLNIHVQALVIICGLSVLVL